MGVYAWRMVVIVLFIMVLGNLVFLDWVVISERNNIAELKRQVNATENLGEVIFRQQRELENNLAGEGSGNDLLDNCGDRCLEEIGRQVNLAVTAASSKPNADEAATGGVEYAGLRGTFYVPLGFSGSSDSREWKSLPTTSVGIDWGQYEGGDVTVFWEAFARVHQGNGAALVRLFDETNGIAVPGSEMQASSEGFVHLKSGEIFPWAGNNIYVVQVKSLTGYEVFYEGGKIRIDVK